MFNLNRAVGGFYIRECVRTGFIADQHTVALTVISGVGGVLSHLHLAPIGVAGIIGGNALGNDTRPGVFTDMDHLCPGIGLHMAVGQRYGIEFSCGVVALKNTARVFPGDGRSGFYLCP